MRTERAHTRRRVLRAAGVTLGAALAGCSALPGSTGGSPSVTAAPVPRSATPTPPDATVVELVDFAFEPGTAEPLDVAAGTTVRFVWTTDAHNIRVDTKPSGATWRGHRPIEESGFVHEHTFEVTGRYEFWCEPHRSLGMTGTLVVE